MATIVVTTFELGPAVSDEVFAEADERYQQDVAYQQAGLLRRTTARADDHGWCIVETWAGAASTVDWQASALGSMVVNVDRRIYDTLD